MADAMIEAGFRLSGNTDSTPLAMRRRERFRECRFIGNTEGDYLKSFCSLCARWDSGEKRKFYCLKHSIATHLLDAGGNLAFVKDWLGK